MIKFYKNKSSFKKEKINFQQEEFDEMRRFYYMLLKMKKKRPHMNVDKLMSSLYGDFFDIVSLENKIN